MYPFRDSLLKAAEELSIQKKIKEAFGGGMKEYVDSDRDTFEGKESQNLFRGVLKFLSTRHHNAIF